MSATRRFADPSMFTSTVCRAEKATITYDPAVWTPEKLASEIEVRQMLSKVTSLLVTAITHLCPLCRLQDFGFEATPLLRANETIGGNDTVALSVYGMTCAS